jgi:hypothetical protein
MSRSIKILAQKPLQPHHRHGVDRGNLWQAKSD